MNSIEVAARFAAYTWFRSQPQNKTRSMAEAHRYVERHHKLYLDVALENRNLGRLLSNVIAARERSKQSHSEPWVESQSSSSELCAAR